MRIAQVIDNLAPGGAERVVEQLAAGLARRGHGAYVYCLKDAGDAADQLRARGVIVREARSMGRDPLLALRLGCWLRRDRIDIVHAHSSAALIWALPAAKVLGVPLVQTRHGCLLGRPSRYRALAERLAPLVDRLVLVSEVLRAALPPGPRRRHALHVPNGIDRPRVALAHSRELLERLCGRAFDGPVVLSVGTICAEKDTRGLLKAFAALRGEMPQVHLVATAVGDVGCVEPRDGKQRTLIEHGVNGLLVPPRDPAALADALRYALSDSPAARRRCANAARDHERLYTAERMVVRYESIYRTCIGVRSAAPAFDRRPATPSGPPRVLMLGPASPRIGGMVSAIDTLMTGSLRERYRLVRFATTTAPDSPNHAKRGLASATGAIPASFVRHARALAGLIATLRRHPIDLLHIHTCSYVTFWRNLLDLLAARALRRPCVLHIRGGRFERFCEDSNPAAGWLIRRACESAAAVVVLSDDWRRRLRPYMGRARMVVIPNAVHVQASRLCGVSSGSPPEAASNKPCRFLFLGALSEAKGLGDLIQAASALKRAGTPFTLVIAGPDANVGHEVWARRLSAAGLQEEATLIGPVVGVAKTDLLNSVDCLVHPSHSEGLPFTVLEAAAAGLPVIATDVGSVADVMTRRPGGEHDRSVALAPLVAPHDPPALASEMMRLAGDAALRQRIGRELRTHVAEHFSLDRQVRQIQDLYESILKPKASAARRATAASVPSARTTDTTAPLPRKPQHASPRTEPVTIGD
ncbi:MAG: glycosyltransferase family 4 protein [Planctomycetes bacterium]|nr:glycosyltransferase family 4 protein [Planctomycetota bacterium]